MLCFIANLAFSQFCALVIRGTIKVNKVKDQYSTSLASNNHHLATNTEADGVYTLTAPPPPPPLGESSVLRV